MSPYYGSRVVATFEQPPSINDLKVPFRVVIVDRQINDKAKLFYFDLASYCLYDPKGTAEREAPPWPLLKSYLKQLSASGLVSFTIRKRPKVNAFVARLKLLLPQKPKFTPKLKRGERPENN